MEKAQQIRAFQATVDASIHGLESLVRMLEKEQQALASNNPEFLEQAVKEKLDVIQELSHSIAARNELQHSLQLPEGLEGGRAFLETFKAPEKVMTVWQKLTDLSKQVVKLNNMNGQMANEGARSTRQALSILTGRSADEDTYSANPRKRKGLSSYDLGKA